MKQGIIAIWALAAVFCPLTAGAQARGKEPQNTLRPLEGKAPQNVEELYADFDPRREPLETQTVREWRKDGIQYRYVVYTVGTFRGRKARMAAFYGFPEGGERLPALLHLHGGGQRAFVKEVKRFAGRGYACLSINWGGRPMETMRPGEPNTDWGAVDPTQKNVPGYSSLLPGPKTVDDVESPRNNNWFLLNLGARRGITFLEQQPEVDAERIGVYGHSMGGRLTGLVAGTDDRVKAASPSVGGSGFLQTDLPGLPGSRRPVKGDLALFQRTISGQAYLERVQCPILFLSASNDFNAPMDFVARGMTLVPHTMRYETYAPHLNHRFTPPHEICRPLWFDAHLKRTFVFPETPRAELVLERENGVPLFRVTPDASRTIARVDIYYGYERDPRNRFWADGRAVRRGDVWEAECPVFDLAEPLFVFANVHYRLESRSRGDPHTFALSVFRAAYPPELKRAGVRATAERARVIDDFSRGWRDWYMLDSGNPRRWRFTTRKLADPRWAGPEGARLAFEVDTKTSGNVLAVELQVNKWRGYTRRPEGTFVARVPLTVRGSNKVSLGLEDFKETKDPRRTLSCWSEITELTFRSASKSAPWEQAASSFRNLRWEDGEYGPTPKPFLPAGGDDAANWQEERCVRSLAGSVCCPLFLTGADIAAEPVDLSTAWKNVLVINDYSGTPDKTGVLEYFDLKTPQVKQAVYYRGEWWPYGGNRVCGEVLSAESLEGGLFSILELKDGTYLAVLPLCGDQAYAWLAPENGVLKLKLGTKGTAAVSGDMPLVSWARAKSPYEAANKAWRQAGKTKQIKGHMKLREQKPYPEMFRYLGWCSWEEFKKKISSDLLVGAFRTLEKNELPVRYMLVDDGHFSQETLMPKADTFPDGYKPLTDLRNDKGIKWVGMWHALLGEAKALDPGNPPAIADAMMTVHNGKSVPKADQQSIRTFMDYLFSQSRRDGIDFVKVDFCGTLLPFLAGTTTQKAASDYPETNANAIGNPSAMATRYSRIYQEIAREQFDGLLNCNWHVPHFIFNSGDNAVGRCGPDYKLTVERARRSIFNNFSAMPWLGQVAWGDHDMFHSTDKLAVRMMAISKALSGGPTYLSDNPAHLVPEEVWPLCYLDGRLPRPLAPGAPLPEDIFMNQDDQRLYRAMAPLPNRSVAIACYNLLGDGKKAEPVLGTKITAKHYQSASAMIQPYAGDWKVPKEGLLVYDFQAKSARRLPASGYPVELAGFGEHLIQLSPIEDGWAVIGRTDKYLSAATVEVLDCRKSMLKLRLCESGPFAIWLAEGEPVADGIQFQNRGDGLFVAHLPVRAESLKLTIKNRRLPILSQVVQP